MKIQSPPLSWEAVKEQLHELRVRVWQRSKNLRIHLRQKLSLDLALILSVGIIIRESEMFGLELIPKRATPFLILPLAVLTFIAALWELRGNKLSDSPQDINFMKGMEHLLTRLETFVFGDDQPGSTAERAEQFTKEVIAHTCNTLCGGKKISGAMLLVNEPHTELTLVCPQPEGSFQEGLKLQVPNGDPNIPVSPGGVAFREAKITYMPRKKGGEKRECSLLFDWHGYQWTSHVHGWVRTMLESQESFRSLLCIPVTTYRNLNESWSSGVLTFTTTRRDPFVPYDFQMGRCFSKVLGQMFVYARLKDEMKVLRDANEKLKTQTEEAQKENQNLSQQLDFVRAKLPPD
ncbi:MAG: hypothetical protein QOF62_104 [Pyrinomonadaceae bacterium]|jgi:hypothetical protein|nr:hypothetical protein [Pyrinomonadaceae bacterium]